MGTDPSQAGVRPYTTSAAHGVHTDNSDIVGLLCIRDAMEGGLSNWASSVSIHNALLRMGREDLVEAMTTGAFWIPAHNAWGAPSDSWDDPKVSSLINKIFALYF